MASVRIPTAFDVYDEVSTLSRARTGVTCKKVGSARRLQRILGQSSFYGRKRNDTVLNVLHSADYTSGYAKPYKRYFRARGWAGPSSFADSCS